MTMRPRTSARSRWRLGQNMGGSMGDHQVTTAVFIFFQYKNGGILGCFDGIAMDWKGI